MNEMKTRTDLLNDFLDYLKTLEKTKIKQAKQEKAKEIFDDLDKFIDINFMFMNCNTLESIKYSELKKKHLEG